MERKCTEEALVLFRRDDVRYDGVRENLLPLLKVWTVMDVPIVNLFVVDC